MSKFEQICKNCEYYSEDSENVLEVSVEHGWCKRYPSVVDKIGSDYCGEFRRNLEGEVML